jgi:hypothetical protein
MFHPKAQTHRVNGHTPGTYVLSNVDTKEFTAIIENQSSFSIQPDALNASIKDHTRKDLTLVHDKDSNDIIITLTLSGTLDDAKAKGSDAQKLLGALNNYNFMTGCHLSVCDFFSKQYEMFAEKLVGQPIKEKSQSEMGNVFENYQGPNMAY